MKFFNIEIDGKSFRVPAEQIKGQLWFHWNGESYCREQISQKRTRGKKKTSKPGQLLAPMPGKIIKILAQDKAKVSAGDRLLVMEAMKMEYSLSSDIDGQVKELNCKEGDQVSLGQLLIRVEE